MRAELVTTLKRKATDLLSEVNTTKEPILITHHGLPSAYLVDAEQYEMERRRMKILEGIARGERALAEGRWITHEEARKRLSKWLK